MSIIPLTARSVTSRRTRALAAAGVLGVFISGCGSSSSSTSTTSTTSTPPILLNTKRVALAIEHSIFVERRLHSKVTCPSAVPQEKGHTFTCIATTKLHGKPVETTFTVLQKNDRGNVTYSSPS